MEWSFNRFIFISIVFFVSSSESFYLPGVAPRDFQRGDPLQVKVNKLSSTKTQLPYDYYYLNYCKPKHIQNSAENLGEVLRGDRIENSVYMEKIDDEYRVNMILDNLPVAVLRQRRDGSQSPTYEHGFRVGFKGNYAGSKEEKYFINNHLSFRVMYHKDPETDYARIVGLEVTPNSTVLPQEVDTDKEVVFTYDVTFKESDIKWASRWDTYLLMNDDQIHWFSIINSLMIVLFLSGFLSPSNRGGLMTAIVILWVFMGLFAGYSSARLYKMFKGTEWKRIWGEKSSGAVSFWTMFALVCLWFGISVPLVFVGSYLGFKKPVLEDPVKTNKILRQVPEQACEDYHWWWRAYLTAGSSALYLFLYSVFYFTKLEITKLVSGILYFGYMSIASYAFFVLMGTIGLVGYENTNATVVAPEAEV
ncbi:hypothetical protein L1987_67130 [Smallanthus sonchifolius]|uniref:Uncharacterized protein n=1 Tax=Smallanthus sonchifolius TaxID=185202 RepID=A0ACB9BZH4_9ASTR|nr:hypothetical protein L1987_67130 [Smallanthus sonchifolius]